MFQKLTKADLERYRGVSSFPEYADFIGGLKPGEGGVVDVAAAKVGRQTVKNRLKASANALGVPIRFVRSKPETVVFMVKAR
jgi:hypothetical protein